MNGEKGWLQLVHRIDHSTFHKIYHPEGYGGKEEWGGGSIYRK